MFYEIEIKLIFSIIGGPQILSIQTTGWAQLHLENGNIVPISSKRMKLDNNSLKLKCRDPICFVEIGTIITFSRRK